MPHITPGGTAQQRAGVVRLAAWLLVLSLPALVLRGTIAEAAATGSLVTNGVALSVREYLWTFGLAPIVAVSAGVLFMSPGLLLTYLAGRTANVDRWLVSSLAVSLVVVTLFAATGQAMSGTVFRGGFFGWSLVLLVVAIAAAGWIRPPGEDKTTRDSSTTGTLLLSVVVPVVLGAVWAPKLYWEAFNGDGVHAFESTRLLLSQPLPFWDETAGAIAGFPGLTSMLFAFPGSWYMRLFGAVDGSVRLPLLLYLPLTVSGLAWLIASGKRGALRLDTRLLVWLSVITYAVAMSWSATYNPYAADIALPATQDTLLLVAVLGFVAAFVDKETWWAAAFATLMYVSLPSGVLLIGFWMLAIMAAWRPIPWREVRWLMVLMAALVLGGALVPRVLAFLQLPVPGEEYGLTGMLRYFAFVRFTDVARLAWVALPAGIVPIVAVVLWGKQDRVARALALVSIGYFVFFYIQANVSLHHFVPSMLLPVAVLWRVVSNDDAARRGWVTATGLAGIASLGLVLPARPAPAVEARRVGQSIWNRVGGYDQSLPATFASSELLGELFPVDWDPEVPSRYGGSPLSWHRYARPDDGAGVNYVLQRSSDGAPPDAHRLADSAGFALYVRSDSVLASHRALRPPTPAGSRWLAVPRWTLFRTVTPPSGTRVIDVAAALKSLGFPVDEMLRRLAVPP
jgi:hypothetical protein